MPGLYNGGNLPGSALAGYYNFPSVAMLLVHVFYLHPVPDDRPNCVVVVMPNKTMGIYGTECPGAPENAGPGLFNHSRLVHDFEEKEITGISSGYKHILLTTSEGEVYSWGNNSEGQLGRVGDEMNPKIVQFDEPIIETEAGMEFSLALSRNGNLYQFGRINSKEDAYRVPFKLPLGKVISMCAGPNHAAAVTYDHKVYTWGTGLDGRLGHGDTNDVDSTQPRMVDGLPPAKIVLCAVHTTMAFSRRGDVFGWGTHNGWFRNISSPDPDADKDFIPIRLPTSRLHGDEERFGANWKDDAYEDAKGDLLIVRDAFSP